MVIAQASPQKVLCNVFSSDPATFPAVTQRTYQLTYSL